MKSDYPFQKQYETYLNNDKLANSTQITYSQTISNFFCYLIEFNPGFALQPTIENVFDRDIANYLTNLQVEQSITNGTYNKLLSQITHYFTFLFSHGFTVNLPTINLHGQTKPIVMANSVKWISLLPEIIQDNSIHVYTKMVLLLCSKGYTVQEFLQPNFFQEFNQINFTKAYQETFIKHFINFIQPLQLRQQTKDLFLKQRVNLSHPRLSNAGLHKYLSKDETYLNIDLSPKKLHQAYILTQLNMLNTKSDLELMTILKLDSASLLYYKKLVLEIK